MAQVRVSFLVEADDPDHDLGVSSEFYDEISDAIMSLGGEDPQFEKVD